MPDAILVDQAAIESLMRDPGLRDAMIDAARPHIRLAQALAPKRTGRGAASIHAEAVLDGDRWEIDVGWSQERYYMRFHEQGTRYMPPRPFLVPAFSV